MSRERDQWVIPASAGITDYFRVPRVTAIRISSGEVILYASTTGDENLADVPTCLRMPNDLAEQIAFHLLAAVETNRQRGRS